MAYVMQEVSLYDKLRNLLGIFRDVMEVQQVEVQQVEVQQEEVQQVVCVQEQQQQKIATLQIQVQEMSFEMKNQQCAVLETKQELKAATKKLEELQKFIYTEKPHLRPKVPSSNCFSSSSPGCKNPPPAPPDPKDDRDNWLVWVIQLLIDFLKFLKNKVLPLVKCTVFCTTVCAIVASLCAPCLALLGFGTILKVYVAVMGVLVTIEEILGTLIDTLEDLRKSLDDDDDPSDIVSTCNTLAKFLILISKFTSSYSNGCCLL